MFEEPMPDVLSTQFWEKRWKELQVVWGVWRDPRLTKTQRAIPLVIILYLISPMDLIPGFIPILGQVDDLVVLFLGLRFFLRSVPQEVVEEYKLQVGLR